MSMWQNISNDTWCIELILEDQERTNSVSSSEIKCLKEKRKKYGYALRTKFRIFLLHKCCHK